MDTMTAAAKGAALLDEKAPGWDAHIDLDTLDLNRFTTCIIGQLEVAIWGFEIDDEVDPSEESWFGGQSGPGYHEFNARVKELLEGELEGLNHIGRQAKIVEYGFDNEDGRISDDLTFAWTQLIRSRHHSA